MSASPSVLRNTALLMAADVLRPFVSFFLVISLSRKLGATGLGEYDAVLSYGFFFEIIATLGLRHVIVRGVAVDVTRASAYLTGGALLALASSAIVQTSMLIVLGFMTYPPETKLAIGVLSFSTFFVVLGDYLLALFEGMQRMEFRSLVTVTEAVGRAGTGVLLLALGYGVLEIAAALLAVRFLVCLLSFSLLLRLGVRPTLRPDRALCVQMLRDSGTFLLITLVSTTYWTVDTLMLSQMRGLTDVGRYTAAYRLVDMLRNLCMSYIAAFFPAISHTYANARESFQRECSQSIRWLFLLTFPVCVGSSVLAGRIIGLVYGAGFEESATVLRILVWIVCVFPVAIVFANALVASHNQRADLLANIIAMVFNVALNFFLIPHFGPSGSAAATLCSILFFFSIQRRFVSKLLFKPAILGTILKPGAAGLSMGALVWLMGDLNIALVVVTAALFYLVALIALRAFSDEEIAGLQGFIRARAPIFANR